MQWKFTWFWNILYLFAGTAVAQNNAGKVNGRVNDATGPALESATVSLQRAKDSVLVKMTVSDKKGRFEFEGIPIGEYYIVVSAVGFSKYHSKLVALNSSAGIQLPAFQLQKLTSALHQVTVTAKRPLIENKIDRMVINVEAAPTSAGASALEVLEKSPGVTVSNEGDISLRGKQGVRIMIDGKPTYLSPADLANVLKNLPASTIDQIELMTNPPARYDAGGNSGIINIKTKKSLTEGLNGSLTAGGSVNWFKRDGAYLFPKRTSNSLNVNYRKGKWNLFGNASYNYRASVGALDISRRFYEKNGDLNAISESHTRFNIHNNNYTLKAGFDFFANKKNIVGVVVSGFGFFGRPSPAGNMVITRADGTVESVMESVNKNTLNQYNYSTNINYKHIFDAAGREFTADIDYVGYYNGNGSSLVTNVYDNYNGNWLGGVNLRGDIPGYIDIYSVKGDYVHPLQADLRIDAGFKISAVRNDNKVDYQRLENGVWRTDDRSNRFIYREHINAGYVSLNKKWNQWSAQAGLRIENTIAHGRQVTNDSSFTRNYTSLFPTLYINYTLNKVHAFTLSYGRRIERPNYQDLNPFVFFLDSLTYRQGNPYLVPQYSNNIEFRHTLLGRFTTTFNYTVTNNLISQIIKQHTEKKLTYQVADNVAQVKNIGVAVNAPFSVAKRWNVNLFVNMFHNRYAGRYYNSFTGANDPISIQYTSVNANISNSITFKKGWSGELSAFYRGRGIVELSIAEPSYFATLGIQKIVMKGKATLRCNVRDPFNWQHYKGHTLYSDIDIQIHNRWDNSSATVSFSYRFGKATIAQARRRTTGATEEQNRVGIN